jgi:hypothetical protein
MRTGSGPIVGNGFQIVGAWKECPERDIEPWIIFHQPPKLSLDRRMSFEYASRRLEDQTLRSVEPRKVAVRPAASLSPTPSIVSA